MAERKIKEEFVVKLGDKEFVKYEGLLDLAHHDGLISIETEMLEPPTKANNGRCIFKATARTENKTFTGYGDADPANVNRMVAKHVIRMAETRAKARALRDLTNVGMTAMEELGGEDEPDRVTADMLSDICKEKNVPEQQLIDRYGRETGKKITDIKYLKQEYKQKYYLELQRI